MSRQQNYIQLNKVMEFVFTAWLSELLVYCEVTISVLSGSKFVSSTLKVIAVNSSSISASVH